MRKLRVARIDLVSKGPWAEGLPKIVGETKGILTGSPV